VRAPDWRRLARDRDLKLRQLSTCCNRPVNPGEKLVSGIGRMI
jgi:hypothetical protein